jgi:hypothetical protein
VSVLPVVSMSASSMPRAMRLLADSVLVPEGDTRGMNLVLYRRDERGIEESRTSSFHPVKRNGR